MFGKLAAQVAGVAVEAVGTAHGIKGLGRPTETLVQDLLRVQDEQAESLRRIERNVQRLIDAPWLTARIHLQECLLPGRTAAQLTASLHKAADLLRQALGQQSPGTMSTAYVALDLAIVLVLVGDREASQHYARIAIEAGTKHLMRSAAATGRFWLSSVRPLQATTEEWYWLANAVAPICGWPYDQLDLIGQGPSWLSSMLENIAASAWSAGEVHSGWIPHGVWDQSEQWGE